MKTLNCVILLLFTFFIDETSGQALVPVRYTVDAQASKIKWTGYYLFSFGEHFGSIRLIKGEILEDKGSIVGGSFEIDMRSIKNLDMPNDENARSLADHLMNEDFFNSSAYPTSTFNILRSEAIKDVSPGQPNVDLIGELTIKGVKKPLKFPAHVTVASGALQADARFKFDRTLWGVHYNSGKIFSDVGDGAISDAIALEISLTAKK